MEQLALEPGCTGPLQTGKRVQGRAVFGNCVQIANASID